MHYIGFRIYKFPTFEPNNRLKSEYIFFLLIKYRYQHIDTHP